MSNILVWLLSLILPRRMWYRRFYLRSAHWRKFRQVVGSKRKWHCQKCKQRGYDVHHKKNGYKLWRETLQDVKLLCRGCHKAEHGTR